VSIDSRSDHLAFVQDEQEDEPPKLGVPCVVQAINTFVPLEFVQSLDAYVDFITEAATAGTSRPGLLQELMERAFPLQPPE
jgi:hypothetical protein